MPFNNTGDAAFHLHQFAADIGVGEQEALFVILHGCVLRAVTVVRYVFQLPLMGAR